MAYIQIDTPTGGSGTYQASTTYYNTQAGALAGAFATITLSTQYLSVPNGTWWVAMRDANNIGNVIAKSIVVSCTTTTTTTFISPYAINYLSSSSASSAANPATLSYASPANTTLLILEIASSNSADSLRSGGDPTWNGLNMVAAYSTVYRSEIWYLTHTTTGTNTLSIPNTSSTKLTYTLSSFNNTGGTAIYSCTNYSNTGSTISSTFSIPVSTEILTVSNSAIMDSTSSLLTTASWSYSDTALNIGINNQTYGYLMQYHIYYSTTNSDTVSLTINTSKICYEVIAVFTSSVQTAPVADYINFPNLTYPMYSPIQVGSSFLSDGGYALTARGICYGVSPNPTTANSTYVLTNTIGAQIATISISPGTYYFSSYATNTVGTTYTAYTTPITISSNATTTTTTTRPITTTTTTLPITTTTTTVPITTTTTTAGPTAPTVTTGTAGTITYNSIQVNNNQSIKNGSNIITYGLAFSNYNTSPTLSDSYVSTPGDPGSGLWNMNTGIGLTPSTTYYFRAFATNGVGTSYGSTVIIATLAATTTTTTTIPSFNYTVYGSCTSPTGIWVYYKIGAGGTWTLAGSASPVSSQCPNSSILNIISVPSGQNLYIAGRSSSSADATFGIGVSSCSSTTGYFGEATPYIKNMIANVTEYVTLA